MKNKGLLLALVAAGVGSYYLYRLYVRRKNKKRPPINASAAEIRALKPNPTSSDTLTDKEKNTIEGLNFGLPYTVNNVNVKTGVILRSRNLVPNAYDRGVGETVGFDGSVEGGFYHNMSGVDTVSISAACKCAPKTTMYKTEIPKLP